MCESRSWQCSRHVVQEFLLDPGLVLHPTHLFNLQRGMLPPLVQLITNAFCHLRHHQTVDNCICIEY